MNRKSTILPLLLPLLLGGCHGAFITINDAKEVFENIKTLVLDEPFTPEITRFTSIRKKLLDNSGAIEYTKTVFDNERFFYTTYTVTQQSSGDSVSQNWYYRYDVGEAIYFIKYGDSVKDYPTKINSFCDNEEDFLNKWNSGPLATVTNQQFEDLKSALNRINIVFEEVDSTNVITNVSFMSSNDSSLYMNANSKELNVTGGTDYHTAKIEIDDLFLESYEYSETSETANLYHMYAYDNNKAFITYPDIKF